MSDDPIDALRPLGPNGRNRWQVSAEGASLVRPQRAPLPLAVEALPKPVEIDLARAGLLVIDMQNDFCHPDGWRAGIGVDVAPARRPIAPLQAILPVLRAAGVPVVWVNWGARADRANLPPSLRHVYDPNGAAAGPWTRREDGRRYGDDGADDGAG